MASVATIAETTLVGDNEDQLVTMIVDNQLFGIPILQVQDIVEASKITPVPLAPSAIAGVLNLRGRIVTVIDLRKLLGNSEEVAWENQMGVTIEHKGDLYTLLVDAIGDVRTLARRDFDSAPSTMEDKVKQLCAGIYRLRGNLLVVLDVARILKAEVIEATPALSVEERRARKAEAMASMQQDENAGENRQLSALMTDLNAYESDMDDGLGALSTDADDIKARKKANRNRRPVGERWKEVLDEKARQTGQSTYRMREPNEETLEDARDDMEKEEKGWEVEWEETRARGLKDKSLRDQGQEASDLPPVEDFSGTETASPAEPESQTGDGKSESTPWEPPVDEAPAMDAPPEQASAEDSADEKAKLNAGSGDVDAPESHEGSGIAGAVSDWWSKMRGKSGDEPADDTAAAPEDTTSKTDPSPDMLEATGDDFVFEEPAEPQEAADDTAPVAKDSKKDDDADPASKSKSSPRSKSPAKSKSATKSRGKKKS